MNSNQCDYCLYMAEDEETGEWYCSMNANIDQDDIAKMRYSREARCPYFRMGDDYTIVKKQAFR